VLPRFDQLNKIKTCGLFATLLLCVGVAQAEDSKYLTIGTQASPLAGQPYRWKDKNNELISKGLSDKQGRAFISAKPGVTDYYLELISGVQYPVKIEKDCWLQKQEVFETCIQIGEYESSPEKLAEEKADLEKMQQKQRVRELSVNWVYAELKLGEVSGRIDRFITEHTDWWENNQASIKTQIADSKFTCTQLSASLSKTAPIDKLNAIRAEGDKDKTRAANIDAAKKGNWLAASRLAIEMLDNEDWESATPVIAWMIKKRVPAAYNRLADLIGATSTYEHGTATDAEIALVDSLRWHGALLGDPGSQITLAEKYQHNKGLADTLNQCAKRQRPDY
jgi:hypothetical protein